MPDILDNVGKGGTHKTLMIPLEVVQKVIHVDNCCTTAMETERRYTYIMSNRVEWNRPVPLCCGQPQPYMDPCQKYCYNKVCAGLCGGYTDRISVLYYDDPQVRKVFYSGSRLMLIQTTSTVFDFNLYINLLFVSFFLFILLSLNYHITVCRRCMLQNLFSSKTSQLF